MKEEDCKASSKFLQAVMYYSDNTIGLWKDEAIKRCVDRERNNAYYKFVNWERQANEIAIFTMYAYADFAIPKQFDCIFNYNNPEVYIQVPFILTQVIWEGWFPVDFIDNGHKHLCIFAFEENIPDIIKLLHCETEKHSTWKWDAKKTLGLCKFEDLHAIIADRYNMK